MTTTAHGQCLVPGNHLMAGLLGTRDELLRQVEQAFPNNRISVQGNRISVEGPDADQIVRLFDELVLLLQAGQGLDASILARTIDMVSDDIRPSEVLAPAEVVRGPGARPSDRTPPGRSATPTPSRRTSSRSASDRLGPASPTWPWPRPSTRSNRARWRGSSSTRPAVEAGERLGFLPGDLMAKVDPYLRPLYDALYDLLEPEGAQRLLDRGTIEVAPLAFMRGRTLDNSFIILDEAQNTTPEQMKMFLTRIGFGSKCVVTGDITQIDVQGGRSGLLGLEPVLGGIEDMAFVHLTRRDVVRHKIVADIVDAYEVAEGRAGTTL